MLDSSKKKTKKLISPFSQGSCSKIELNIIVGDSPANETQSELIFNVTQGVTNILNWMKHIIRGVQQDKTKVNAFESLQDASTGFWFSD